jgi:hypothetical protein
MGTSGNGSGKGTIVRESLAPGWVIYRSGEKWPDLDTLLKGIFQNINADLAEHPEIVPLAIIPIVRDGNTVAMCMGYGKDGPEFPSR